jgi:hypothetical protein
MAEFCPHKHAHAPFKLLDSPTQLQCRPVEAVLRPLTHMGEAWKKRLLIFFRLGEVRGHYCQKLYEYSATQPQGRQSLLISCFLR